MAWRILALALVAGGMGGCATTATRPAGEVHGVAVQQPMEAQAVEAAFIWPASALAFDPPAGVPMDLSREGRGVMAFGGFQQSTQTASYVRTDDRQSTGYIDSYDRRAVSVQFNTTSR